MASRTLAPGPGVGTGSDQQAYYPQNGLGTGAFRANPAATSYMDMLPRGTPASYQMPPAQGPQNPMADAATGIPGATPTTPASYTGTQQGANPAGTGFPVEPFFESGRNAALRYLQGKGINPYAGGIGATALLSRADDIIASVLGRAVQGGSNFSDPTTGQNLIQAAFEAASHNAPGTLMGRGEAQGALGAMKDMWAGAVNSGSGTPTENQTMLATLLSDPSKLANLATSMQFGTSGSRMQAALSRPYQDLPFWLTEFAGNRLPGHEYGLGTTALELLLSGAFPRLTVGGAPAAPGMQ